MSTSIDVGAADARTFDDGRPESSAHDADANVDSGIEYGVACAACGPVCPNTQVCVDGFCAAPRDAGTICNGVFCSGTCAVGRCRVSVVAQYGSSQVPLVGPAVYADDTHLYWVDAVNANVVALRLADGAITKLSTQHPGNVGSFTRDTTSVYFSQEYFSNSTPEDIVRVPLCGGSRSTLASGVDLINSAIVVTDRNVFWSNGTALESVPVDGGSVATVPDAGVAAADATNLYYFSLSNMQLDAWVTKVPIAGGAPVTLAPVVGDPSVMVVDANNVYWGSASGVYGDPLGTLMSVPLAGGTTTTLASGVVTPRFLALDEATVYFAGTDPEQGTGSVMSVPIAGGTVTTLAQSASVTGVAVNWTSVFWTDFTGVYSLTPKGP